MKLALNLNVASHLKIDSTLKNYSVSISQSKGLLRSTSLEPVSASWTTGVLIWWQRVVRTMRGWPKLTSINFGARQASHGTLSFVCRLLVAMGKNSRDPSIRVKHLCWFVSTIKKHGVTNLNNPKSFQLYIAFGVNIYLLRGHKPRKADRLDGWRDAAYW